ncbi:MAG TPA: hypothetical protein V6C97_24380 [Oculatellaceae cyanobacterium]
MGKRGTYKRYSIACAVVWTGVLLFVAINFPAKLHTFSLVFGGWWIGWLSSTIARSVYPSPGQP